mgnify:FL=1
MTVVGGPNIIRDNLSFYVDAANIDSYPGSGSTWTDLSGNGFGNALFGATTYSTSPDKFDTNATDHLTADHLSLNATITYADASAYTFEFVVKLRASATATYQGLVGYGSTNPWLTLYANNTSGSSWDLRFRDNAAAYNTFSDITDYNIQNNWAHIAIVVGTDRNMLFYLNGAWKQTKALTTSLCRVQRICGGYSSGGNYYSLQGSMALSRGYTSDLSATEILQNFNATKDRFSI